MPGQILSPIRIDRFPGSGNVAEGPRVTVVRGRGRCLRRGIAAAVAVATLCPALLADADAAAAGRPAAGVRAAASGGTWGRAREVPGLAALNVGYAQITSVSCASAGNCSAGGSYQNTPITTQAFVVSQKHGTWGKAEEVPGLAALNTGGSAEVRSVSCASAGNCSAGGEYFNGTLSSGAGQGFVVSQRHGVWGKALEVPGLGALNVGGQEGGFAQVWSVSCASAGNCSVGGRYTDSMGNERAFVASQTRGIWGKAKKLGTQGAFKYSFIYSLSCGSAGNCSAGGLYPTSPDHTQAFVASQKHGTWGRAQQVPGSAALNAGHFAQITSVSCTSAGNCSAGGFYSGRSGDCSATGLAASCQAFVVSQRRGTWGQAQKVPGAAALNAGGNAQITSVSCASAGNCSAGGFYTGRSGHIQAFVVSQKRGTWGRAQQIPGTAALNAGGNAQITSVSCASANRCSAVGFYTDRSGRTQAFVVSQT
jgi:hypothetical protein